MVTSLPGFHPGIGKRKKKGGDPPRRPHTLFCPGEEKENIRQLVSPMAGEGEGKRKKIQKKKVRSLLSQRR